MDNVERIREYHNVLAYVTNTVYAIRSQINMTYEQKLLAVGMIEKALPILKRHLIYFRNTKQ